MQQFTDFYIDDQGFGTFIDVKKTLELNRDLVKVQMGTPNGPCIALELLAFYPSEDQSPAVGTPLPGMGPMTPFTGTFMSSGQYPPHLVLPHPLGPHQMAPLPPIQPRNVPSTSSSTQINPVLTTNQPSRPASSLPTPPRVVNFLSDGFPTGEKKRKPSLDLNPIEQKRRKSEHFPLQPFPLQPSLMGAVNPRDVIDLTYEESAA